MRHIIQARVFKGERQYVAECLDLPVVTQGRTLDKVIENLREAVSLALKGEDFAELGLSDKPTLLVSFEFPSVERHPAKLSRSKSIVGRGPSARAKRIAG